jgi:dephospho-CoA kinase
VITIGLTGGIASGKSVASEMLARLGARVVDVDKVAHETYRAGTPGFRAIVGEFGREVVGADGEIDRRRLGELVFGRPDGMKRLTDIVWPLTRARLEQMRAAASGESGVLVFEAAVLIEAGWTDLVDEVWVVSAPIAVARQRLMARNGLTAEQADARIASQLSNSEREARADVVIVNDASLATLEERVAAAWHGLTARAGRR